MAMIILNLDKKTYIIYKVFYYLKNLYIQPKNKQIIYSHIDKLSYAENFENLYENLVNTSIQSSKFIVKVLIFIFLEILNY